MKRVGMWHEARKQEKKIRVMMVDHKRRADRRRQFYEQIKQDPTQFMRVYGRPYKIHLEPSIALAADGPQTMMPWRGDEEVMIDRFDVRSHLDLYTVPSKSKQGSPEREDSEERNCNYERYRILVQNDVAGVQEEICLRQIYLDELYGAIENKKAEEDKKKSSASKAAIGFVYEDSTHPTPETEKKNDEDKNDEPSDDSDFDEIDLDNIVDIYNLSLDEVAMLNRASLQYGMDGNDFYDNLELDKDEAEALRMAKLVEEEKAQFSGRKSRRERRAFKERRMKDRPNSPPAYAARESPKYEPYNKGRSASRSKSKSPDRPEQFSFISSFGGDADEGVVQGPTLPAHLLPKGVRNKILATRPKRMRSRSRSRSPDPREKLSSKTSEKISHLKSLRTRVSRSPSKSRSKSRSRSRSRSRNGSYSRLSGQKRGRFGRSRSRSRDRRYNPRSRSRSRSPRSHSRLSGSVKRYRRSRSYSRSRSSSRSRSRSRRSRSRSRSFSSRSRSSSYSRSRSRSRSYGRSRSSSRSPAKPAQPVFKSYRRPSLSSNSSGSGSDSDTDSRNGTSKASTGSRLSKSKQLGKTDIFNKNAKANLADKMKLKMQKALKRQLKADIKERQEKEVKAQQKQQDREDELRAIAIQMRRREREKRHKDMEEHVHERRRSRSGSRTKHRSSRSKSRHRSRSPTRDRKENRERRGDWEELHRRHIRENRDNRAGNWEDLQKRSARDGETSKTSRDSADTRAQPRGSRDSRELQDTRDGHGDSRRNRDPRDAPRDSPAGKPHTHRSAESRSSRSHHRSETPPRGRNMPKLVDY